MSLRKKTALIKGLSADSKVDDLHEAFSFAGDIANIIIPRQQDGTNVGHGYIVYTTEEAVGKVIFGQAADTIDFRASKCSEQDMEELEALHSHSQRSAQKSTQRSSQQQSALGDIVSALKSLSSEDKKTLAQILMSSDTKSDETTAQPQARQEVSAPRRQLFTTPGPPVSANEQPIILREQPKLSFFSGDKGKDTSYARWQYDVNCLEAGGYEELSILQAIRRSLKSPAADVVRHLGPSASVDDILTKLHSMYGTVLSGESILQKFYSEPQTSTESCAQWAARVEELCYCALEKKAIEASTIPDMLRSRFWRGLRDERLKNATRHIWSSLPLNELLERVREAEEEYGSVIPVPAQSQQSSESELDKMVKMMEKMNHRLDAMERRSTNQVPIRQAATENQVNTAPQTAQTGNNFANRPAKCTQCGQAGHLHYGCRQGLNIECNKCHNIGHIARGCRTLNE